MNLSELDLSSETIAEIEKLLAQEEDSPSVLKWPSLCESFEKLELNPKAYQSIWETVFDDWNVDEQGPRPMWFPTEIEEANLTSWMIETGTENYKAFHDWSKVNRSDFWQQAIDRVDIRFATQPESILDTSDGVENAKWLTGCKYNIAESCFKNDDNDHAIVEGDPDGSVNFLTYRGLNKQANQIAASLVAAGYQAGDAIGVFMPMTARSVAIYLGMVRAGIAVVSIADSFAPPEIENRLRIANAKAVFTYDCQVRTGRQLPLLETLIAAVEIPAIVIPHTENELAVELREQDVLWDDFLVDKQSAQDFQPHLAGPDHIVNILFSSGTTGDPKAIPWTQTTPIKCAVDGFCHHDLKKGDVVCWPTNLGWMMGPWLIFATLINRGTIALYNDAPMTAEFGRFVQDAKVNMLGVVPTIVKAWRLFKCMEQFDWSNVNAFSSTGETSQADDMFYLSSLANMRPVIEYCGGTEIGGGYVTSTVVQPNAPATFSTPALGLDLEILDEEYNPTDSGELFVVPPSIGLSSSLLNRDHFETYFASTPSTPENPVLRRHGDHMTRLPGGFFVAGGRVDDTMNLGGIKTSSAELERVMNQIEGVKETAAVAVSEAGGPNSLVVFAVGEEAAELNKKKLKIEMNVRIREQLNPLFKVKSVHIVDSMPRTASGKVMRRKLRDQLAVAK